MQAGDIKAGIIQVPQNKNEDDWAARARAWAASKTVTDDQQQQQQQPHSVPANRPEEINYQGQYSQNPDPPYPEYQQNSHPPANYQQYPSFPPPPRPPANQLQEPSFNSGYASDGQFSYPARDGNLPNSAAAYPHQDNGSISSSGYPQEVPSSYSSVAGKEEPRDMNGQSYQPSHMHFAPAPQHQVQPSISPNDRSMSIEQPHYAYNNSSTEPTTDPSNQPLDFGPRYGHDPDPYGQSTYGHESGGSTGGLSTATAIPSINAWNSSAMPGMPYPSLPPAHPTGQQADLSPASMHSAPLFGGMAGSGFQPGMQSANTAFPIGASNAFNAANAFPGDTYGIPGFPERPKKKSFQASVPNWLKEEIIKKKPFIGSSAPGLSRQGTESNEDDDMDQPLGKGEQVDGKSMELSRSKEEESEDEDQIEAARTAAINQEIKRILTEVLLKVTDELFDEIATQVIEEDDLNMEVGPKAVASRDMISASSSAAITPKSSAKVLIPAKTKGTDMDDASGKSSSSSPGDVLGLGSYASDDDEDMEVQNSSTPSSTSNRPTVQPAVNGSSPADDGKVPGKKHPKEESDSHGVGPNEDMDDYNDNSEKVKPDNSDVSKSKQSVGDTDAGKHEPLVKGGLNTEDSLPDDAQGRSPRNGVDKNDNKRRSSSKDYNGEVESGKDKKHLKVDESSKIQDEKHIKREKKDDQNGSKEKIKERDSEKRVSKNEIKDDKKERDRDRRSHAKEDDRKRERKDEKKHKRNRSPSPGRHKRDRSPSPGRHKRDRSPSPGRHKRDRSSSPGRHRSSKDNSSVSRAHGSSDSSSSDSRRKVRSKRRDRSPSPVRSRRHVDDKCQGLHLASVLSTGILTILLLKAPGKGGGQDQEPEDDNVVDCIFEDYRSCDRFVAREGLSVDQS
ncbi:cyclin-related protein [Artemisia annua]|uniref:Cyclin-related protein n=1 Tax=Artemisia annua TaxID=35608 RepID=A0A2U1N9U5_ARTAN|nr:cyclin-related protein [Artemisia annua]